MTYKQAPDIERVTRLERFAQRHKRGLESLFAWTLLAAFVALNAFILGSELRGLDEALSAPQMRLTAPKTSLTTPTVSQRETAKSGQPDPCGLDALVCPGEKNVIVATVTTYQAVKSQTDADPCHTASGMNVCSQGSVTSFYGIIANNCLPFHTVVEIRDNHYLVEDRMSARYGCSTFDILTGGENFKLTNEPVTVL